MTSTDIFKMLLFVLFSASSLVVQKIALEDVSVYQMNFVRMMTLGIFCFLFWSRRPENLLRYFLIGLYANVLNCLLVGFALMTTLNIAISATLVQTNAFFGVFFAWLVLKERPSWNAVLGMGIASAGIFVLAGGTIEGLLSSPGILLLLGASSFWGLGFTYMKKHNIGSTPRDIVWVTAMSALPLFPISLFMEGPEVFFNGLRGMTGRAFICIAVAAFFSTLLATNIYVKLSQKYPAYLTMPFLLLFPFFSGILAWILLGDTPGREQIFPASLILFGVLLSQRWVQSVLTRFVFSHLKKART